MTFEVLDILPVHLYPLTSYVAWMDLEYEGHIFFQMDNFLLFSLLICCMCYDRNLEYIYPLYA